MDAQSSSILNPIVIKNSLSASEGGSGMGLEDDAHIE